MASLRTVLVIPPGQALDPSAPGRLRHLTPITFDLGTFQRTDDTHARISARISHAPLHEPSRWRFTLLWSSGEWRVLDAEPAR